MVDAGVKPLPGIIHEKDVFVWHPQLLGAQVGDIRRITYYTSAIGDEDRLLEISNTIHAFTYWCTDSSYTKDGKVFARVFKKSSKSQKSRSVDINMVIDGLRHATNGSAGHISIYSGDADFVPFIEELMHLGIEVHVKALSSGLSPRMRIVSDEFFLLDGKFFETTS